MHRNVLLVLLCIVSSSVYAFNRSQIHQERIENLDLSARTVLHNEFKNSNYISAGSSDILISQSFSPATFTQDNGTIISLNNNNWIVAFEDNRMGSSKIYLQVYDSLGTPIDSNQLIVSSVIGSDFVEPKLSTDTLGRVYLFFRNQTEGLVYGTRYSSDLSVDIPSFLVNDTTGASFAGPFDFAVYPDGKIAVAWENYSVIGSTIEIKLYNNNLITTFGPATVNSDGASVSHWVPALDVDPSGNILIAWEDYRNIRADIFARLYNGAGTPIGTEFALVPPPSNNASQFAPKVVYSNADDFIIGWVDQRIGQEIYLQRYNATTGLVGSNTIATSGDIQYINWNIDLGVDTTDALHVVYARFGPQITISKQKFLSGLTLDGPALTLNSAVIGSRWHPNFCFNQHDEYAAVWTEFNLDNANLHMSSFDQTNNPIASEQMVNDDSIGAVSVFPKAVVSSNWYNLIVFEDQRNDAGDIFVQAVSNAGIKLYGNIKINEDIGTNRQTEPSIAASVSLAKSLVVWVDGRDLLGIPGQRIFGRVGSELGQFIQSEFLISDSSETGIKNSPCAVIAPNGKTLICWIDNRDGSDHVYGQWLTSAGLLDGANFRVSNITTDSSVVDLNIGVDSTGNFYLFWLDELLATPLLKVQQYNPDGSAGLSFTKSFTNNGHTLQSISAAVKSTGNIVVLYQGQAAEKRLYLAEYQSDGTGITVPFEIIDITGNYGFDQQIAVSNNDYLSTVWVDTRNSKKEVFSQIFDNNFNPVGVNTKVTVDSPEFMITPTSTAYNGRAWFYWADPTAYGLNIYSSSFLYLPTDIDDENTEILPKDFTLIQNYPNPFNPTTEISFTIPNRADVKITIFNMLGQLVKVLTDRHYQAGKHSLVWDATNEAGQKVASGLYFYKMISENHVEMKKMVLLK